MKAFVKSTIWGLLLITTVIYADEPEINIQGLDDSLQSNVRAFLSLYQENCQSPRWRIEKLFAQADSEIDKALRALGYYQPKISKHLTFNEGCWQADFDIDAGEPVRIANIRVEIRGDAKKEPVFQKLLASLPIKQGDILNHALYEKIKRDLQSLALEYGYLQYKLTKKTLQVNPKTRQANIELVFASGPRQIFGEITIDQNILDPDFVHRYVDFESGDLYSSKKLAHTYNDLASSGYFRSVNIEPQMDDIEDRKVPVRINLTPAKKHQYSAGIGFATDIGPSGSLGYKNRYLNRKGHHLSIDLSASPVLTTAEGQYMIPYTHERNDYVSFGLGYKLEQPDTFESEAAKLSLQQQHVYHSGWKQTMFIDLSHETFVISDVTHNTLLLVPGVRWLYTQSNRVTRPTKGYELNFSLAAAHDSLISDVNFFQGIAAGKLITPLPWPGRVITRLNVGGILVDDFERLPPSYRFYAGGTDSVRGYAYKKLGPTNNAGDVIGGKILSVASFEYEHFINESWGIAAFIDAGNAYNIDDISIKKGAGVGVRWVSPIGPIRLDFAVPLDKADSSFQIHFATGAQL